MGYPKQMYKGSYTAEAIHAAEQVVTDDKQEKLARKDGFIDGHEFFSKGAQEAVASKPKLLDPLPVKHI